MADAPATDTIGIQRQMADGARTRLQLYSDLVIGRRGLGALLAYESVVLIASAVPGALGLWLRSKLYPKLLKRCGRGVVFGQNVVLRHPGKIEIGDGVTVDDNCLLDAKGTGNAGIRIGQGAFIGRNSILSCKDGDIVLGDGVNIGFNAEIFSGSCVEVGAGTLLAAYTYLVGGGHASTDLETPLAEQPRTSAGIRVGAGCWIGAGAKVLDGVSIGPESVVGAGSVVTRDIPARSVAAGVPARVLRAR